MINLFDSRPHVRMRRSMFKSILKALFIGWITKRFAGGRRRR
jgi:hypothetical protein